MFLSRCTKIQLVTRVYFCLFVETFYFPIMYLQSQYLMNRSDPQTLTEELKKKHNTT